MPYYTNGKVPSASPYSRDALQFWSDRGVNMLPQIEKMERERRNAGFVKNLATGLVGGIATAGVAPALGMLKGGSAVAQAAPAARSLPAVAGKGLSFGNLLEVAKLGVPAITGLFGMRSQNKALDRQSQIEQQNYAQQIEMARENEAYRRSEAERVAAEEARRWQAEEAYRAKQVAADEEERAFNRRLLEEREARRAPRREASQRALLRLQDLLRLGRG